MVKCRPFNDDVGLILMIALSGGSIELCINDTGGDHRFRSNSKYQLV